jgi:hypothetical protein
LKGIQTLAAQEKDLEYLKEHDYLEVNAGQLLNGINYINENNIKMKTLKIILLLVFIICCSNSFAQINDTSYSIDKAVSMLWGKRTNATNSYQVIFSSDTLSAGGLSAKFYYMLNIQTGTTTIIDTLFSIDKAASMQWGKRTNVTNSDTVIFNGDTIPPGGITGSFVYVLNPGGTSNFNVDSLFRYLDTNTYLRSDRKDTATTIVLDTIKANAMIVNVIDTTESDTAGVLRVYNQNGEMIVSFTGNDSVVGIYQVIVGNSYWRDTNSFENTATEDTVTVIGASVNDFYFITLRGSTMPSDVSICVEATATGFIVRRAEEGEANLKYNWLRVK